jgi:hypothetical protein
MTKFEVCLRQLYQITSIAAHSERDNNASPPSRG